MSSPSQIPSGEIRHGNVEYDGRVIVYIIQADQTSHINYIKPLILVKELECPHVISVIDTTEQWFYSIHPERYVPAIRDRDPMAGEESVVFESTACLQYLAEFYDKTGDWAGRTRAEKATVITWTAYQTAGLGPTAKYWLYFLKGYPTRAKPEPQEKTCAKLHENAIQQWNILEQRLACPGQQHIALRDRPTIADLSYFPFAMPWMFRFFGIDIKDWPNVEAWAGRMAAPLAIKAVEEKGPTYGH